MLEALPPRTLYTLLAGYILNHAYFGWVDEQYVVLFTLELCTDSDRIRLVVSILTRHCHAIYHCTLALHSPPCHVCGPSFGFNVGTYGEGVRDSTGRRQPVRLQVLYPEPL